MRLNGRKSAEITVNRKKSPCFGIFTEGYLVILDEMRIFAPSLPFEFKQKNEFSKLETISKLWVRGRETSDSLTVL